MQYSTKRIDKELEGEYFKKKITIEQELVDMNLERLETAIQEHKHDQLIGYCLSIRGHYFSIADWLLATETKNSEVKRYYYLAAQASGQAYRLVRAGFPHQMRERAGPYNFKKNNMNFTKDAILANDFKLALSIAGEDTIEGLLVMEDYDKAQRTLPQDPGAIRDEITLCCWAIAHQQQKVFDESLKERIKMLRRQSGHEVAVLDSWGLALIQLARRHGMTCKLKVIELPWQRMDDTPVDKEGLEFPFDAALQEIIQNKGK